MIIHLYRPILHNLGLTEAAVWGALCNEFYEPKMNHDYVCDVAVHALSKEIKMTADKLEMLIGVKRVAQNRAIKNLVEWGYIECKVKGVPGTRTISFTSKGVNELCETLDELIYDINTGTKIGSKQENKRI